MDKYIYKVSNLELQQQILDTNGMMAKWHEDTNQHKELYSHFLKLLEIQRHRAALVLVDDDS